MRGPQKQLEGLMRELGGGSAAEYSAEEFFIRNLGHPIIDDV